MSDFSPNRTPAGVPAGGQFAATVRPESEVSIDRPDLWTAEDVEQALRAAGMTGHAENEGECVYWREPDPDGETSCYSVFIGRGYTAVRDEDTSASTEIMRFTGDPDAKDLVGAVRTVRSLRREVVASRQALGASGVPKTTTSMTPRAPSPTSRTARSTSRSSSAPTVVTRRTAPRTWNSPWAATSTRSPCPTPTPPPTRWWCVPEPARRYRPGRHRVSWVAWIRWHPPRPRPAAHRRTDPSQGPRRLPGTRGGLGMSENRQPKGIPTGGQFAASAHGEAAVDLNTGFFPPAPLSPRDVETLTEHQGVFEYGYDADDVNRVLGQFEGAQLVCVWDSFDDIGYGGDSEFVGVALVPDGQTSPYKRADGSTIEHRVSKGSWRRIHPQVWEYLSDSDCDVDPAAIPSLLDDEVFDGPEVDELLGDGRCNLAANADGDL